eukprot:jgi/Chlat1/1031/Chrsp109S01464
MARSGKEDDKAEEEEEEEEEALIGHWKEGERGEGEEEEEEEEKEKEKEEEEAGEAGDNAQQEKEARRAVRLLSAAFFLIFTAFGATQNLETSLLPEGGVGAAALGALYLSLTLSSCFAASIMKLLNGGPVRALRVGCLAYALFILANVVIAFTSSHNNNVVLFAAAVVLGCGAALLWVGQGTYLAQAAALASSVKSVKRTRADVLASFNGTFWGCFQSTQVVGNLLAFSLLSAFIWGDFSSTRVLPTVSITGVPLIMALFGFIDATCSYLLGRTDRIALVLGVAIPLQAIAAVWLGCFITATSPRIWQLCVAAVMFGVGDAACNTRLGALLPMISSKGDVDIAFGMWRALQSGATAISLVATAHGVDIGVKSVVLGVGAAVALACYAPVAVHAKEDKQHEHNGAGDRHQLA